MHPPLDTPIENADLDFRAGPLPRRTTTRIVVHHSAGSARQSPKAIHAWHLQQGWIGLGYNLIQDDAGVWYEGRGLDAQGAHATSHNDTSVGVCLIGNLNVGEAGHELPAHRYASLVELCAALCRRYALGAYDVVGHKELPGAATLCPGKHLDLSQLRRDVRAALEAAAPDATPLWRVVIDDGNGSTQLGAYRDPLRAVATEIARPYPPARLTIERA